MHDDIIVSAIQEVRERLVRVETKIDDLASKNEKIESAHDLAQEALRQANLANERLDRSNENVTWLWRTVIGALVVAVIEFFRKGGV